jgi:HEAT repeat protein
VNNDGRSGPDAVTTEIDRRAAITIAAHQGNHEVVRAGLVDGAPKVRAAALRGLARADLLGPGEILCAIRDESPVVRRTICELAGSNCRGPFQMLLDDAASEVVEAACFALGEIGDSEAVGSLIEIASSHDDPLCREAAVAALGAIGDPAAKPAVLRALGDTTYVRRRAVVALAAFSGDDVDAALAERRDDRDWQVRQAAEDILGINRPSGS